MLVFNAGIVCWYTVCWYYNAGIKCWYAGIRDGGFPHKGIPQIRRGAPSGETPRVPMKKGIRAQPCPTRSPTSVHMYIRLTLPPPPPPPSVYTPEGLRTVARSAPFWAPLGRGRLRNSYAAEWAFGGWYNYLLPEPPLNYHNFNHT